MRVATYNIRNVRALDWSSLWWRRRGRLAEVVVGLDADLIAMQEAYPSQIAWLAAQALSDSEWGCAGAGRNGGGGGGGEAVPLWHRRAALRQVTARTRWFGPTPDVAGSKIAGAQFPRIATIAEYQPTDGASGIMVANLHLDSSSVDNRGASLHQLAEWLAPADSDRPIVVLGDFNAAADEPGFGALADIGLRSVLGSDVGATSNGFGRDLDQQKQIDHIFVSEHFEVGYAAIVAAAGYASDHYPVVAELVAKS